MRLNINDNDQLDKKQINYPTFCPCDLCDKTEKDIKLRKEQRVQQGEKDNTLS